VGPHFSPRSLFLFFLVVSLLCFTNSLPIATLSLPDLLSVYQSSALSRTSLGFPTAGNMASYQPAQQDLIRLGPNDANYYFRDADTNGPSLAGLLGFPNTKELGRWLESQTVQDLWDRYNDFRIRGFGGIATKAIPIGLRDCMDHWAKDDIKELLRLDNVEWDDVPARTRPLLVTLWFSRRLVMTSPEVFSKFVGFPEGMENIARGVRCLRLMWDRKVKKMSVAPSRNQPASSVPRYLDPANPSYRRPDGSKFLVEETHLSTTTDGPTPLRRRQVNDPLTNELLQEIELQMNSTDDSLLGSIRS
jgi:hypothetical protein